MSRKHSDGGGSLRVKGDRNTAGVDIVRERRAAREAAKAVKIKAVLPTFEECAEAYIRANWSIWSEKHRDQWPSSLKRYTYPRLESSPSPRSGPATFTICSSRSRSIRNPGDILFDRLGCLDEPIQCLIMEIELRCVSRAALGQFVAEYPGNHERRECSLQVTGSGIPGMTILGEVVVAKTGICHATIRALIYVKQPVIDHRLSRR
jgi:hypothetical protein